MKVYIGLAILIVSIFIFKWWGILSLVFVLSFIGWEERYKGPFYIPTKGVTDYDKGIEFNNTYPESSRKFQDILVNIEKESINTSDLKNELQILLNNLKSEAYGDEGDSNIGLLMGFLNKFSAIFPNWQSEYRLITKEIRANF